MKDGARVALWLTSIEERKEVPIVEGMPELGTQTQVTWKEQFVVELRRQCLVLLDHWEFLLSFI